MPQQRERERERESGKEKSWAEKKVRVEVSIEIQVSASRWRCSSAVSTPSVHDVHPRAQSYSISTWFPRDRANF